MRETADLGDINRRHSFALAEVGTPAPGTGLSSHRELTAFLERIPASATASATRTR